MKNLIVPLALIGGIVLAAGAAVERIAVKAVAKPTPAGVNLPTATFNERMFGATSVIPKSVKTIVLTRDGKAPVPIVTEGPPWSLLYSGAMLDDAISTAVPTVYPPWRLAALADTTPPPPPKKASAFACSDGYRKVAARNARHYRCRRIAR